METVVVKTRAGKVMGVQEGLLQIFKGFHSPGLRLAHCVFALHSR